jgi:hypothetical protein
MATPTVFTKILAQVWQGECHFFRFGALCQLYKFGEYLATLVNAQKHIFYV